MVETSLYKIMDAMRTGVGGLGDAPDTVTGGGMGDPPGVTITFYECTLILSHEFKMVESLDEIYRFLTEKTYPNGIEKSETEAQLPTKGLST